MRNGYLELKLQSVWHGDHPKNVLATILKTFMLQRSAMQSGEQEQISV